MMRSPYDVHKTYAAGAMMIAKDAALVLKGLARRHLEVPCSMLISPGIFKHRATTPSTMAKPIPASSWWTTASHVE
jgi:hypothetical protein